MYVDPNYKSKKEFIAAVRAGTRHEVYNPSIPEYVTRNGSGVVEGPHYPAPHKWYSSVMVKDGIVVSAK